jgi:Holliday junction resolvase
MEDNFDISGLKKKKKVNSRTKGSTFERQIAKKLNERFNTTEFMRSPGSGAFASTHTLPEHLKIHGDLITPKNFKFCIECKKGYNKENLYSLYNNSSDLK